MGLLSIGATIAAPATECFPAIFAAFPQSGSTRSGRRSGTSARSKSTRLRGPDRRQWLRSAVRISPSDNPPTHYAHDAIFYVDPGSGLPMAGGTANFYDDDPDEPGRGTIEIEWEAQNAGSTASYGQGNIGLPNWAIPTVGDRIYVVGTLDRGCGHPENATARKCIHPARGYDAKASWNPERFSGYGSGCLCQRPWRRRELHAAGAQRCPQPGRLRRRENRDVLSPANVDRYYQAGPLAPLLYPLLVQVVRQLTGISLTASIYPEAGPSAFPGWSRTGRATGERRDYDFDVPLPARRPAQTRYRWRWLPGPGTPRESMKRVRHTGPCASRLPYRGAAARIYPGTLRFVVEPNACPGQPIGRASSNRIDVTTLPARWQLSADVSGTGATFRAPLRTCSTQRRAAA